MGWCFINDKKKWKSRRKKMRSKYYKTKLLLIALFFIVTSHIQSIQADTIPIGTGSRTQSPSIPYSPSNNSTNKPTSNAKACTALNSGSSCRYRTRCYDCINTKNCIFDTQSRLCSIAKDDIFITAIPNYCEQDDVSCRSCTLVSTSPHCMGASGCICRSTCEIMAPQETKCEKVRNAQNMRTWIILIVLLIFLPYVIWIKSRCVKHQRRQAEANASIVHSSQPPTRRRPRGNENYPPGLSLHSWRNHLKDRGKKLVISKDLQLSNCYLMYTDEEEEAKKGNLPPPCGSFPLLEQRKSYCKTEIDLEESKQSDEDDIEMKTYIEIYEEEENHLTEIESVDMLESPTSSVMSNELELEDKDSEEYVKVAAK